MAFTVQGQCSIDITIAGYQNFVDENTLLRFIIKEEAGNVLPTWEMDFFIDDTEMIDNNGVATGNSKLDVIKNLNEGSIITASLGDGGTIPKVDKSDTPSGSDKSVCSLFVSELSISYEKYPYVKVYMGGIAASNTYTTRQTLAIIKELSSIEAVKLVAIDSFGESNLSINPEIITNDTQNWVQYNISSREFIQEMLMHSYISAEDFLLSNIGIDGSFKVEAFSNIQKKIADKTFKYTFTNKSLNNDDSDDNDNLISFSNIGIVQANGLINTVAGYEPQGIIHDLETGLSTDSKITLINKISNSDKLNRTSAVDKIATSTRMINDNVHEMYWDAYYSNVANLLVRGTTTVCLTFPRRYLSDLKVLDPVQVFINSMENRPSSSNYIASSDFESGYYVISKIVRCYMNKNVSTSIYCSRENLNSQMGSFK